MVSARRPIILETAPETWRALELNMMRNQQQTKHNNEIAFVQTA